MKLTNLLDREGLSLAGMVIVMSLLALLVGVFLGNWLIRIVAGPPSDTVHVAEDEPSIREEVMQQYVEVEEAQIEEEAPPGPADTEPEIEDAPVPEEVFVVQVGAFNSRDNAERLKAQMEERGFSAYITDTQPFRVHLGAFENRGEAEDMRDEIERNGFEAFITH